MFSFAGFNGGLYETFSKCLTHSLTVHTKYELAPPYPVFTPKIFWNWTNCSGEYWRFSGCSKRSNWKQQRTLRLRPVFPAGCQEWFEHQFSQQYNQLGRRLPRQSFRWRKPWWLICWFHRFKVRRTACVRRFCPIRRRRTCANGIKPCRKMRQIRLTVTCPNLVHATGIASPAKKIIWAKNESKSDLCGSSSESITHHEASSVNRFFKSSIDVYNFDSGTPNKDDDSIDYLEVPLSINEGSGPLPRPACSTLSFTHLHQGANVQSSSEDVQDIPVSTETDDKQTIFEKPNTILRLQIRDGVSASHSPRTFAGLSIVSPDIISLGRGLALSPGYSKFDRGGSSTCSSCISSPIILQNESQCFTYSVRRYMEAVSSTQRPDSPVDLEGTPLIYLICTSLGPPFYRIDEEMNLLHFILYVG